MVTYGVKPWEEHISLKRAWALIAEITGRVARSVEKVPLASSYDRILAKDVVAARNVPHFNASAVDGYALSSGGTAFASVATPTFLPVGSYRWLNTGMPIPSDCDSVLMVEDSSIDPEGRLIVVKTLTAGENVRPIGEDISHSQVAARKGERITPALAALLLALGLGDVEVRRLPQTLYIPTGDEIVPAEEWLRDHAPVAGKVAESNSTMIAGYFRAWGYPLTCAERVADDPALLAAAVREAAEKYDLVLIGAGSSKGEKDFTSSVLEKQGEILFHWLLMKPGRPALVGKIKNEKKDVLIANLPGFPMSTAVVLWSVVYPLLLSLHTGHFGESVNFDEKTVLQDAVLSKESCDLSLLLPHSSPPGKSEWIRLKAVELDGQKVAFPLSSGSSTMWAIAEADGFALLPDSAVELPKGTKLNVWLTKKINWERRVLFQGSNDPAFELLGSFVRDCGGELVTRSVGSLGGLAALSRGECHLASCHLLDAATGNYNDSYIERMSGGAKWTRVLLYWREQGIVVAKGNPLNIRGVEDFTREDVRIVNRQPGAGTRVLLDYLLTSNNMNPTRVKGYEHQTITHFDAANRIVAGLADAALAIRVVADSLDLDFVPLTLEPYELVIPEKHAELPGIAALLKATRESAWRRAVEHMGGYRWEKQQ